MQDAHLPPAEAQVLVDQLTEAFDKLTKAAKERALKNYLPKAKKGQKAAHKTLIDKLIAASNLGVLDEAQYRDAIAEQIGVQNLSDEQAKVIVALAEKIQTAISDFDRNKAIEDLVRYIDTNVKGFSWADVGMALWYSFILSGLTTQAQNIFGNLFQTMNEVYAAAAMNPRQFPFIFKGLFQGYGRGLLEAWETVATGYQPFKSKTEQLFTDSPILEQKRFMGGPWNPLNYAKFVQRFMGAADVLAYHGLKEMRSRELAVSDNGCERRDGHGDDEICSDCC
mgnify:CR=1 FL=1